ncbi:MAG: lipid-A-disaccharide synthase [Candidatus Omnitrophota bacterium]
MEKKRILIVAGEASGDLHASSLVREIKKLIPQAEFFGLGGKRLKDEGVNLYFDIVGLAVVGFFEVLKNLTKFKSIFQYVLTQTDKMKPDLAILVDYPGFNLRLAVELKKRRIPVIYYISPQVWAWGKKRIETIKKVVDLMLVVFKFEEELYREHSVPVSFVGHPLLDIVRPGVPKEELFSKIGFVPGKLTLSLLPGSREKEVRALLPIMLEASRLIHKEMPESQFLILRSPTVKEEIFTGISSKYKIPLATIQDMTYEGILASDFCLVASGTATLETAILCVPMAILYKVSFLTWAYIKMLIRIPYIGLVNVIYGEKVVEEFIQSRAKPELIARHVTGLLKDSQKLDRIKTRLYNTRGLLGENGASQRASRIIADFLKR